MASRTEPLLPATAADDAGDPSSPSCGRIVALALVWSPQPFTGRPLCSHFNRLHWLHVDGRAMLAFFGVLSTASLLFIDNAADRMNAGSHSLLGALWRACGAVLWSLLGLLGLRSCSSQSS